MYEGVLLLFMISATTILPCVSRITITGNGNDAEVTLQIVNALLTLEPRDKEFVMIFTKAPSSFTGMSEITSAWGLGVFEVTGNGKNSNATNVEVSRLVAKARHVSWSITVVVMSDDPAFLASFTEWSLKGRLLLWSHRLLVLTRLSLSQLTHIRPTLSMTNSMLVQIASTAELRVKLYIDQPYSKQKQLQAVASWSPKTGFTKLSSTPFYADKFAILSERPRIVVSRVVELNEKTEIIEDPEYPGDKKIVAFNAENQLIETIAKAMNFSVKFVRPDDDYWGHLKSDGTWSGMVGMVHRKEATLGLGLFTMTPERAQVVDFTFPVTISYARILAPRGSPEITVWGFLLPLRYEVWIGIILALLIYALVMVLPSCIPADSLNIDRLSKNTFNFVRVLFQQDVFEGDGWWWWERVVLAIWMLMTLVLTKSYSGNLMSLLAVRTVPEPYQTLEDLVDSNIVVYLIKGTAEIQAFMTATQGAKKDLWDLNKENRIVLVGNAELGTLQEDLLRTKSAHITLDIYQEKLMARDFTENGFCSFSLGSGRYIPALDSLAGPKDSPLVTAVGNKVRQVSEAGLYDYWQSWYFPNLTACLDVPTKFAITSSLAITNLWGMFVLIAGGWLISLLMFAMEVIIKIIHNNTISA